MGQPGVVLGRLLDRLDDFLTDDFFRSWIINPDEESDFFWTSFLENNPDKYSIVISLLIRINNFTELINQNNII